MKKNLLDVQLFLFEDPRLLDSSRKDLLEKVKKLLIGRSQKTKAFFRLTYLDERI